MPATPLLQKIDAVTVPVPDLDAGPRFYHDALGHQLRWRNDQIGQAGLRLPGSDAEIVLTTRQAVPANGYPLMGQAEAARARAAWRTR